MTVTVGLAPTVDESTKHQFAIGNYPSLYNVVSTGYLPDPPYLPSRYARKDFLNTLPLPPSDPTMLRDNVHPILNGPPHKLNAPETTAKHASTSSPPKENEPPLEWDWELEHEDRKFEAKDDVLRRDLPPFQVDRKLLKDIVREKMGTEVARIKFLGAGTFHKGYLITLVDGQEVVARVARRLMPYLKTDSEVATMLYLRERTNIPVPTVYHYDSNPYNRLGGEYIIMSKAVGIPVGRVFHGLSHNELITFMRNLAMLLLPLFAHRFPKIGSLYSGPDPDPTYDSGSAVPTPTPANQLTRSLTLTPVPTETQLKKPSPFHVGPIISWAFFGSHRGDLKHPEEINRGPWPSSREYLMSCVEREINGVLLENEGKVAPHRLHLDPDEIHSSRHHRMEALPDDESDNSDEYDWEESEEEWEGPGDSMYRDYRRMQRSTFLIAHLQQREQKVRKEMARFVSLMERLHAALHEEGDGGGGGRTEEFALDCHDLSLENVFVDENDFTKITCIIDWESTTTRPLWAAAHVPALVQSSPFTSKVFRVVIEDIAKQSQKIVVNGETKDLAAIAQDWLYYEAAGVRLRMAHRVIEWDGWEEGLVDSILGPEDQEDEWFKSWDGNKPADGTDTPEDVNPDSPGTSTSPTLTSSDSPESDRSAVNNANVKLKAKSVPMVAKVAAAEKEKEKLLNATGDYCGGRGGELGRRLDAWLSINGDAEGRVGLARKWEDEEEAAVV